jgi:mRNA interferase HigB
MKVLGLAKLRRFSESHTECVAQIRAWIAEAKEARWNAPKDVKVRYVNANFLRKNRVVFDMKGNGYRLDTKLYYEHQVVIVKRVGTHSEYDEWEF